MSVFVVESGTAREVGYDINRLMDALASLLDKVEINGGADEKLSSPTIALDYEYGQRTPTETTAQPQLEDQGRLPQLEGFDPQLLAGRERLPDLSGVTTAPLLDSAAPQLFVEAVDPLPNAGQNAGQVADASLPVEPPLANSDAQDHAIQIQIGDTQIAGTLAEVQEQFMQLPLEKIEALHQAVNQPVGTAIAGEPVMIAVDNQPVLQRDESGQMLVNQMQQSIGEPLSNIPHPALPIEPTAPEAAPEAGGTDWQTIEAKATNIDRVAEPAPEPHLEVLPVAQVESLTGVQLGDSSSIHDQVVQQAPSIVVSVDDEGKVKPGSYQRAAVEATEDEVENGIQTESYQAQMLTPEAMAVMGSLKQHFQETGDSFFVGQEYLFHNQADGMSLIPHDEQQEPISVVGDCIEPAIDAQQFEQLMQRFSSAYERIQVAPGQEGHEQDYELG